MAMLIQEMPHRPNVALVNPAPIADIKQEKTYMQFTVPVRKDTATLTVSFPQDGGVRIHDTNKGMFEPSALCDIVYEQVDENTLKMSGNGTSVLLTSTPQQWELAVFDRNGNRKTALCGSTGERILPAFRVGVNNRDTPSLYRVFLPMEQDEEFYGFGERFNGLKQNGSDPLMWNVDILVTDGVYSALCFDDCDKTQAYKNIPLIHSTNNYAVFFNTFLPIAFDIGKSYPAYLQADIYGMQFDLYIWTDSPAENLLHYHKLTGTPFVPPKWAFDYWLGGGWPIWNTPDPSYAFENLTKTIDKYASYGIKVQQAYLEARPTEEILGGLRDRGIRTFMWTDSRIAPTGKTELDYNAYRVKKASDPNAVMPYDYIDFTTPKSKEVICEKFRPLWDMGVCGEMVDFADSMPEDALCANGKNGTYMHNEYAYWYGRRLNEAFDERLDGQFVLFQRSGCAGSHHYTAAFGGDSYSSFLGLKRSVWQLLSASASGVALWGSDIGGFTIKPWMSQGGPEFEELYMRWVQFGAFSPLMRDHSWHGKHHPWANGENGLRNFQYYYTERMRLLDHVYSTALGCRQNGGTVVQSMAVAYGASPSLDTQYIFCKDFLVRPVLELGQRQADVCMPEDGWYEYYTGVRYDAGTQVVDAPADKIPLFVKAGAVIAYRQYREGAVPTFDKEAYDEALLITPAVTARQSVLYTDEGALTFESAAKDDAYQVTADAPCARKTVVVLGAKVTEVLADVSVDSITYDELQNRTTIVLNGDWTDIRYTVA